MFDFRDYGECYAAMQPSSNRLERDPNQSNYYQTCMVRNGLVPGLLLFHVAVQAWPVRELSPPTKIRKKAVLIIKSRQKEALAHLNDLRGEGVWYVTRLLVFFNQKEPRGGVPAV